MNNERVALDKLRAGDLFHARYPKGPVVIALVLDVTPTCIRGRDITRQEILVIDRKTGMSIPTEGDPCTVFSTEQLPADLHEAILGLDRKYGSGRELTDEECKLTMAERKALIFVER